MRLCVQYIGEMHLKSPSKKCEKMRLQRVKCIYASTATGEMRQTSASMTGEMRPCVHSLRC